MFIKYLIQNLKRFRHLNGNVIFQVDRSTSGTGSNRFYAGNRLDVLQLWLGWGLTGLAAQPPQLKRGRSLVERRQAVGGGGQLEAVAQVHLKTGIEKICLPNCSKIGVTLQLASWVAVMAKLLVVV